MLMSAEVWLFYLRTVSASLYFFYVFLLGKLQADNILKLQSHQKLSIPSYNGSLFLLTFYKESDYTKLSPEL